MKTNLRVFTAAFAYKGEERLDTTVKTGVSFLAPTWEIVMGHKQGKITDEQYTEQYLRMMDKSMQDYPDEWIALLRRRKVVLICYCGRECFCHRHLLALWLEKMGAKYIGEINTNTNVTIPADRHMHKCLNEGTQEMVRAYEPKKKSDPVSMTSSARKMIVDPLAINTIQSSTCRQCRENRKAIARTQTGNITFHMVEAHGVDTELKSSNLSCCSMDLNTELLAEYKCPIFSQLIEGYFAGVTSQGTNLNPCKNCIESVDNGGTCFGDRCTEGPFPILEGAGLVRS